MVSRVRACRVKYCRTDYGYITVGLRKLVGARTRTSPDLNDALARGTDRRFLARTNRRASTASRRVYRSFFAACDFPRYTWRVYSREPPPPPAKWFLEMAGRRKARAERKNARAWSRKSRAGSETNAFIRERLSGVARRAREYSIRTRVLAMVKIIIADESSNLVFRTP